MLLLVVAFVLSQRHVTVQQQLLHVSAVMFFQALAYVPSELASPLCFFNSVWKAFGCGTRLLFGGGNAFGVILSDGCCKGKFLSIVCRCCVTLHEVLFV